MSVVVLYRECVQKSVFQMVDIGQMLRSIMNIDVIFLVKRANMWEPLYSINLENIMKRI